MPLSNTQYQVIMREYNRKQLYNRRKQRERAEEVYRAIPQYRMLEEETASLAVEQARKLLTGDHEALNILRQKIRDRKEQKEALLLSHGFPADYLEMRYSCRDCQDTGYIGSEKCHCFRQAMIDLLYTQSNLQEILKIENFDTFSYEWYSREAVKDKPSPYDNMRRAVEICWEMIDQFDSRKMNLLLTGPAGVGKTFLTHCIARELLNRCYSVIYLSAIDLFDIFSKEKFDYGQDEEQDYMYQYILDCDMLMIDDLGTELNNTFTTSQLFYCMNEREKRGKPVVISTNLSLATMRDYYSERITSRIISSYRVVELYGADIRVQKKLKQR